jgi:diguanylate cyclase (GGDEF)-like protein
VLVLIADDSPMIQVLVHDVVTGLGHDALVADDGATAWAILQREPVDVVISDWMMPGLEGPELCQRMRAASGARYVYFIFLTALSDRKSMTAGMRAGADDFLSKPPDPEEIESRLIAAKRVVRLQRSLEESKQALERANEELFLCARTDALTGLGNRRRLDEDLPALADQCRRYSRGACVALCDIDHFKAFNDLYGHLAGDRVLHAVGEMIRRQIRGSDPAYRYGGEELLIVFPEQPLDKAIIAMERVRRSVEELAISHEGSSAAGVVTISIGIAELASGLDIGYEEAIARADKALYRAKARGRNQLDVESVLTPPARRSSTSATSHSRLEVSKP